MEDHESTDKMFGRFQTIINSLRSLGKTCYNYDHITKILQNLPRQTSKSIALKTQRSQKGSLSNAFKLRNLVKKPLNKKVLMKTSSHLS
ncbi:hypothetical protein CR513_32705, partial [Mucuna pruriens]